MIKDKGLRHPSPYPNPNPNQAERLRASESARQLAEERAARLEAALQAVQTTVGSVL